MPGLVPGIDVFWGDEFGTGEEPGVSKDEEPHRRGRMVGDGAARPLTVRFCQW